MTDNITIFNNKSRIEIIFQEEKIREIEIDLDGGKTLLTTLTEAEEYIEQLVDDFEANLYERIRIYANDTPAVFSIIQSCYKKFVIAAGGLVTNELDEILVINRLDKWDLPKGKVKFEESIKLAAVREVEEETGLQNIEISSYIISTFHTYIHNGKWVLKETYWFDMTAPKQNLTPQLEEDITEAKWIPIDDLPEILSNTYENIKMVLSHVDV